MRTEESQKSLSRTTSWSILRHRPPSDSVRMCWKVGWGGRAVEMNGNLGSMQGLCESSGGAKELLVLLARAQKMRGSPSRWRALPRRGAPRARTCGVCATRAATDPIRCICRQSAPGMEWEARQVHQVASIVHDSVETTVLWRRRQRRQMGSGCGAGGCAISAIARLPEPKPGTEYRSR